MAKSDIIVIGASAGGISALKVLLRELPQDLPAAIFIVVHLSPSSPGFMPELLSKFAQLPIKNAEDGELFRAGHVYVAPPDHHLLLDANGRMKLSRGPKENRSRPAVDPLFRSAALAFGARVVGIVLSGGLNDGTAGLVAVKQRGGIAIVQDPFDAEYPSMPSSAARAVAVDHSLPVHQMGAELTTLVNSPDAPATNRAESTVMEDDTATEVKIASGMHADQKEALSLGSPSLFTCPECNGTLLLLHDQRLLRFRCHTGHAFTAQALVAELNESCEALLWSSVRALEEMSMLLQHIAAHDGAESNPETTAGARLAEQRAKCVRDALAAAPVSGAGLRTRSAE